MTDDTCPVCGKGEYRVGHDEDGTPYTRWPPVSHLDCVRQLEERAKASEYNFGVEHDALVQAEAEVERLKRDNDYLTKKLKQVREAHHE